MVQGRKSLDAETAGLLYRERFGLSFAQLQEEPADQVGLWLAFEHERSNEEKRRNKHP